MKKIALLFPGQGSQYIGMGKKLYDQYNLVRRTFEEANDVLGFNIRKMCFEGKFETLTETQNVQPALLTLSVAAFRAYMYEIGIPPEYLAGHSLGEYSALTCAGVIDFADAVRIVRHRGLLMEKVSENGSMAAVKGIDKTIVEKECKYFSDDEETVVIACCNSQLQSVISGNTQAVKKAGEKLETMGAEIKYLKVSNGFHSPLMQGVADKLTKELKRYKYNNFKWPVISNVTSKPYVDSGEIINNLALQMTSQVRWQETMEFIQEHRIELVVELGPKNVLNRLVKEISPSITTFSLENQENVNILKDALLCEQDNGIGKNIVTSVVTRCLAAAVSTRNRNWNEEEYQKGVVEPYRKIEKIQNKLEDQRRKPTVDEIKESIEMVKSIFVTKKIPVKEQNGRIENIVGESGVNLKKILRGR
ncbi:ACP S-malonyltransferase [Clostridium estertheticum]|uniref:ACP S-malonyltransferase n=1 Tax=Clostridium estertheticum TaxID=238834 RepID=UPI001CF34D73|nr:ACP S-malonyltransferase [Clostridium estertheticum]MCB2354683.1 ACP S-malonyltransferase [Clostridium estertheticum]WAG40928.1 ACP S-malonyltransferase [Clostridium estertheticum]